MAESVDYSKYILPVGLLLGGGLVLQKFGLLPSMDSIKNEKAASELDKLPELRPGYAKKQAAEMGYKKYSTMLLKPAGALAVAAQLKRAKGIVNDDELGVYSAFKAVRYKTQVSQVAEVFKREYNLDLLEYLRTFLNDKELARVSSLIDGLPPGISAVA